MSFHPSTFHIPRSNEALRFHFSFSRTASFVDLKMVNVIRVLLACAFAVAASVALAQSATVEIFNNTAVDLCVDGTSQRDCKQIRPKQAGQVSMRLEQWIRSGTEARRYNVPKTLFKSGLRLQAEVDGRLYLIPQETPFPASPLPKQPSGFPLESTRKVELN